MKTGVEIVQPEAGQLWNIMHPKHPYKIHCPVKIDHVENGIVYATTVRKRVDMTSTIEQWNEWTRTGSHVLASK